MDFDDEDEKKVDKGPKFPIQMYITEGNKYFRLGKYDLAIEFFNKGLEKEPTNEKCLIGRSKCYMGLAKYSEAKEDAEKVAKSNPKSCDAKMLIGEADYFLGDFEKAFLTFYRGYRSRTNHIGLRCGHQMCRKAIDNALKPDVAIVIDDEDVGNLFKLKDDLDIGQRSSIGQDQYSADVDFVNSILQDDSVEFAHQDCEFLKNYLRDRQIFWKTQNPNTSKKGRTDSSIKGSEGKAVRNIHAYDSDKAGEEVSTIESHKITPEKSTDGSILKKINAISKDYRHMPYSKEEDDSISLNKSNSDISKLKSTEVTAKSEKDKTEDRIHMPEPDDASNLSTTSKSSTDSIPNITDEKTKDSTQVIDSDGADEISSLDSNSGTLEKSSTDSTAQNAGRECDSHAKESLIH